ncbi:hypothetical protein [Pseudocitrobacter corydidari]
MTTELAQRMKAAALKLDGEQWQTRDGFSGIEVIVKGSMAKGRGCVSYQPVAAELADSKTAKAIALFNPANIKALVEALEARDKQIADSENRVGKQNRHVCELFDDNTALRQRIIELEEKLQTSDKLQDSAFRHGLQHGFSLGQTDNQAGFEQCMTAYSQKEKNNG